MTEISLVKQRICDAFEGAEAYDDNAAVQKRVAERLAATIAGLPLGRDPRILEIGCGTGFLAGALELALPKAEWLMTDIAPAMVARSRLRFGYDPRYRFAVLDGERPDLPGEAPFDLVCSSLTVQWFEDWHGALDRLFALVRPGGWLAFSTLTEATFEEWRRAHRAAGQSAGTPAFPARGAIADLRLEGRAPSVDFERFVEGYENAPTFLHTLRAIGADTPRARHRPLSAAAMRAVMRRFEEDGAQVTYEVALCCQQRAGGGE